MQKNSRVAQGRNDLGQRLPGRKPIRAEAADEASCVQHEGPLNGPVRPLEILVVDDDPVDRRLLKRAFQECGANVSLRFCENGSSAFESITKRDDGGKLYAPDVCICDINMPGMSGIDLLTKMKQGEETRRIPVVMLSSSDDERDVRQCYNLQAASYVCKPHNYAELCKFAESFVHYWIELVSLPTRLNLQSRTKA